MPAGKASLTPAHAVIARAMLEDALQKLVLDAAKRLGWRSAHFRPAKTEKGWRTAVQGDGKGFPDLILLRNGRGLAIELKSQKAAAPVGEQWAWLEEFGMIAGFEAYVWRPVDWLCGRIEERLT